MPSPVRRSTRAAPVPAKPSVGAPSVSSSSSLASTRHDRKSNGTLTKSATPHSRSSEELNDPPRRSQRAHPAKDDMSTTAHQPDAANGNGNEEEEEVTRCVCGHQDYPGPPQSEAFQDSDLQGEDVGGLFIQCDGCSVWQHGGCVGIIEESQSPDKYYCEDCRPKLHDLHTDPRGQRYSLYRPLHPKSSRKGSMSKSDEKARKDREAFLSRASADPVTGKRRATMRSKEHDDEEEQLRRALEESRREVEGQPNGKKNGKRGRDDSEDSKQDSKRLRRASESLPSIARVGSQDTSSDREGGDGLHSRSKKVRQDAAQSARQLEMKGKESEREKLRQEAAGRRQERAGRRRGEDGPEDFEEPEKPFAVYKESSPRSSQPPSPPPSGAIDKSNSKRGPGRKGKRVGNNQYTKGREQAASPTHSKRRDAGASSGDEQVRNVDSGGSNVLNKQSPTRDTNATVRGGRIGKGRQKGMNGITKSDEPVERTFTNMKRSLDFMMSFVSRQQIDMAGDRTPLSFDVPTTSHGGTTPAGGGLSTSRDPSKKDAADPSKGFDQLRAMEMADVFSRNVEKWNRLYSHLA